MQPETSQLEYWNGPAAQRWIHGRERMDRSMESITLAALALAAPRGGERVLDVGCGCATTSLMLAARVAPGGSVVGVDISAPMLAEGRARAAAAGAAIELVEADAGTARLPGPFDLVFSRFGVMFFADPVAAFGNLRAALTAPGGRMVFACWRAFADNPWAALPLAAARDLLPPMEPFPADAPGPFAFADRDRLHRILTAAGFSQVAITPHDDRMLTGTSVADAADYALMVGPLSRAAAGLPDDVRAAIRDRVADAIAPHAGAGAVALPAAVWLVSCRP